MNGATSLAIAPLWGEVTDQSAWCVDYDSDGLTWREMSHRALPVKQTTRRHSRDELLGRECREVRPRCVEKMSLHSSDRGLRVERLVMPESSPMLTVSFICERMVL